MPRTHLPLKPYQQRSLDALTAYLTRTQEAGAATAFEELAQTPLPYIEVPKLPKVPYVCLRVPTGGGKTLMAAHAVTIAAQTGVAIVPPFDFPFVLWLVPSRTILDQTLDALRDHAHPYRTVLTEHFGAALTVHDLAGAQQLNRGDAIGSCVVIVTTMQGLRVEDRDARKIYEQNGALMAHFSGVDEVQRSRMEIDASGMPPASLCNLLRIHRPLVIVDEAHNSRTSLSFETLARFNPSAILEFTATPNQTTHTKQGKFASNVLHATSAAELKSASMIKLPIRLWAQGDPVTALGAAIGMQQQLEERAKAEERATAEYLRPLVLIQAQNKSGDWTVEATKQALLEQFGIPDEQIVIATGSERGLEQIDLKSPDCPVRYIITIQALREGWDCSFAYVLCSLANTSSETAVEQILGRVLRLPGAKAKRDAMLNCAYAYVASTRFAETASALADALIENGFQRFEASRNIVQEAAGQGTLFEEVRRVEVSLMQPPQLNRIADETLRSRVEYNADAETLVVRGAVDHRQLEQLKKACANPIDSFTLELEVKKADGVYLNRQTAGQVLISVPWLAVKSGKQLDLFEESVFLSLPWNLADCDPALTETDYPSEAPQGYYADIDLDPRNQKIVIRQGEESSGQLLLGAGQRTWDLHRLVGWLDREIDHPDITMPQSVGFLRQAVEYLVEQRRIELALLVRERFRLKRALEAKIAWHRKHQRQQAFQTVLFGASPVEVVVEPGFVFTFEEDRYSPQSYYQGSQQWKRHQFRGVGELKDGGEEFQVALSLDRSPSVQTWVRNVPRTPGSFWLQTSTDKFYPDFVAQLVDGRILVIEYKGAHLKTAEDAREKELLGKLWAERSAGRCLFAMPSSVEEFQHLMMELRPAQLMSAG